MIDQTAKNAFWNVVENCLAEIHCLSSDEAHKKSMGLRTRIEESPPTGMSSEIFYHAEPFDVACDIAGEQLDLSKYRERYDFILSRYKW